MMLEMCGFSSSYFLLQPCNEVKLQYPKRDVVDWFELSSFLLCRCLIGGYEYPVLAGGFGGPQRRGLAMMAKSGDSGNNPQCLTTSTATVLSHASDFKSSLVIPYRNRTGTFWYWLGFSSPQRMAEGR